MYNVDVLPQCEESRRRLNGFGGPPSPTNGARYSLPPSVGVLECRQDTNGEWIPIEAGAEDDQRTQ